MAMRAVLASADAIKDRCHRQMEPDLLNGVVVVWGAMGGCGILQDASRFTFGYDLEILERKQQRLADRECGVPGGHVIQFY